ncbi:MAG TPA: hypothetical protein DDZ51_05995, partial [Planctomycetaceae bacterium]|nr:hypothetical protein [Planctomycetaceae bacterium]
ITATLSAVSSLPVTINLGFTGTATLASDYTRTGTQIVIAPGQATASVTVTAVQDTVDEVDETIVVDITSIINGIVATPQQAIVTIIDDDAPLDFGDAPVIYPVTLAQDGARHIVGTLFLGSSINAETDGTPSTNAGGDDGDDGVVLVSTFFASNQATTSSFVVFASGAGKLDGWIDFNADGDWNDTSEQIFNSVDVVTGRNILNFTIPAGAAVGSTAARFRLSTAGGLAPTGEASDGEVEDYIAAFIAPAPDAVLELDLPSGRNAVVVEGDNLVIRRDGAKVVEIPFANFGTLNLNGSNLDDVFTLAILESLATERLVIDGGLGTDFLELVASGQTIDLTDASIMVREIEGIDITGTGDNTLVISIDSVKAASSTTDTLRVISNVGDTIEFGGGWKAEQARFIDGQFTHVITETAAGGTARVEVQNDRFFQNPLNRFDVDRSGRIEPLDALNVLIALQQLRQLGMSDLPIPTNDGEIATFYPDVSGDSQLEPLDALLVLITIGRISRGEAPEGERLVPPMENSSMQLPHATERKLVDVAITEFETIDPIATFELADLQKVPEFDVDDWMQKLGTENLVEESEQSLTLASKVADRIPSQLDA